jgi:hypothetical protein
MEDREAEMALARSAAPESISRDAEILVLGRHGYETAVKGKNGFVCIVERSWTAPIDDPGFWNPKGRAPLCLNAAADESFQQSAVRATNTKGKANLRPQDIPKGILIIPYGSTDSDKVWSVSDPTIKKENNETSSSRYIFGMHLFCMVKVHTFSQNTGGCEVSVEVCYKPK